MNKNENIEVSDIFRNYSDVYMKNHNLPLNQLRAINAIKFCRSKELGGHIDKCNICGSESISYNSCRNRHCPKCQFLKKEKWLIARKKDLLPIKYFHVVSTIPSELNPLALRNQKVIYNILFRSVKETLLELANDKKHINAQIGFISILHTWGQNLMDHPHIHSIVTGGGLSSDNTQWINSRKKFFISISVIKKLFRGKFLSYLRKSYKNKELIFPGKISHFADREKFNDLIRNMYKKNWVVYAKPPFKKAANVVDYLGRYTHRVAISNNRIVKLEDDKVSFMWRDYADNNKKKKISLESEEFIRRFLLHILPDRFVKIRYYGFLGNRNRKTLFKLCCNILNVETKKTEDISWQDLLFNLTGINILKCPNCKKGSMHIIQTLYPERCNSP